jgi:hypothetical protein
MSPPIGPFAQCSVGNSLFRGNLVHVQGRLFSYDEQHGLFILRAFTVDLLTEMRALVARQLALWVRVAREQNLQAGIASATLLLCYMPARLQ